MSTLPQLVGVREVMAETGLKRAAAEALKERDVEAELAPLLPPGETAGLVPRIRAAVSRLADGLGRTAQAEELRRQERGKSSGSDSAPC